jgi:hypothetical protein
VRIFDYIHMSWKIESGPRNPLGCAVAITALRVLVDENLAERAEVLGEKFRSALRAINSPLVKAVRGRGLLNAMVIDEERSSTGRTAWQFCLLLKSRGVLAKPTHVNMYIYIGQVYHSVSKFRHPQRPFCPAVGHFGGGFVESREDYRRGAY